MDRRDYLKTVGTAGGLSLVGGCVGSPGRATGTAEPGEPERLVITPESAGGSACAEYAGPTTDGTCGNVSFANPSSGPISTVTTEPGETPYEGTFSDYFEVTLRGAFDGHLELRGCVRGLLEGSEEEAFAISKTIPANHSSYRLRIGPFVHPGGFRGAHLWIEGCGVAIEYP